MTGRLRILTANLWNGGADPERLANLLRTLEVDVACLQEMTPGQAEAVASVLPWGGLEPAADHTGIGIASRAPAEFGSLPLCGRNVRTAVLDAKHWPGLPDPLPVWNAHIHAPHSHLGSLARRRQQLTGLLGHLEASAAERLVLLGDFNATPLWPVYRRLAERLRDAAFEVAARGDGRPRRTWTPLAGERHPRLLRIDHIFLRGVEVVDVRTANVVGSDHDAVIADIALG